MWLYNQIAFFVLKCVELFSTEDWTDNIDLFILKTPEQIHSEAGQIDLGKKFLECLPFVHDDVIKKWVFFVTMNKMCPHICVAIFISTYYFSKVIFKKIPKKTTELS